MIIFPAIFDISVSFFTCTIQKLHAQKLTIETLEQGVKNVQS